jgi:hypothetical protein
MSCGPSLAPDICPTVDDLIPQYLMLLPRGRAWGEGGAGRLPGGIIYGMIWFCAILMAAYHAAICALLPEFWCFSAVTTAAYWLEEYGLPDECDPFPDPCSKIIASGGPTCDNLVALAALTGTTITCGDGPEPSSILITIHYPPDYVPPPDNGKAHGQRLAGCYLAGQEIDCVTSSGFVDCLLQRVVHAHVRIFYAFATS